MERRLIIASLVLVLLGAQMQTASAYVLFGGRWPNQPTSGCCLYLSAYIYAPITSYDRTGWSNGMSAWNSSAALVYFTSQSSSGSVNMTDEYTNDSWDGLIQITPCYGSGCSYQYANLWLNYRLTQGYSDAKIQSVAAHELGHASGLDHAPGCVLMQVNSSIRWDSCTINTPRTDDINGVNAQY
jgi:hypothetical protein